ncbi:MAG: hypothetical protein ACI86M_001052 [Saprospiraceae bacterium]|jgi:hypothetical protein
MKQILHHIFITIALFSSSNLMAQGWQVTVVNVGHLDGRLENFADMVQATVTNPEMAAEVHFLLNIQRNEIGLNISNASFYQDQEFLLNPGMNVFTFRSIADQFDGTGLEDFDYGSPPPGYEDYIREQRRLPPGMYTTCLTVFDAEMGNELASSCLNFNIIPRDAPVIQNPQDIASGAWIIGSDPVSFQVMWIHPMVFNEEYLLEIKKFPNRAAATSFSPNDHSAFDALPNAILPVPEIAGFTYNVMDDDILDMAERDFIAIRVTADASVNQYHNQGRSNIIKAAFGISEPRSCEHPNFVSNVIWPRPGDTLPYRNIHYVVEFDPLCDELREFDATFTTSERNSTVMRQTTVDNRWRINGGGPYHFLEHIASIKGLPVDWVLPDSSYAQQLPLIHSADNSAIYNPVVPNDNGYRMSGNLTYTYYDGAIGSETTQTQDISEFLGNSFHIGMSTPKLISPQNNDTLNQGDITFRFNTGDQPNDPLPPFQILKIDGSTISNPYLNVQEKMVLQVSSNDAFTQENILFDGLRTIQASSGHPDVVHEWENPSFGSLPTDDPIEQTTDRLYREDDFLAQVYKEGDLTFNFTAEDTVWWRVVWLREPQNFNDASPHTAGIAVNLPDIYNASEVRRLIISDTVPPPSEEEEEEDGDCTASSNCEIPEITNTTPLTSLSNGEKFFAGKFEVTATNITSGSGSSFTGTGTLSIPFLNNLNLMVNFSGIRINTDRKLFNGNVVAIEDPTPFRINTQPGSELPYIDSTDVEAFNDWMNEAGRLFSFATGEPMGLPVGIDREIDGRQVIIGMTKAIFTPRSTNVSFVSGFEIPEINTHLSLGVKDVCIQPDGFLADSVTLFLPFDQGVDFQDVSMQMKGGMMEDASDEICYVSFNCNGFLRAKIAMECKFPRSMLIPDASGIPSTNEEERVKFFSSARYDLGKGLMLRFTMDPFYVNGADNLRFSLEEAYLDLSSAINPPSITFPDNYVHADTLPNGRMSNAWEGFYMKRLSMTFADELIETRDAEIGVYDFIIDGDITLKIGAYNIIDDGNIRDWKATLDTIQLTMTQSEVDDFRVKGRLEPPLAADGEYLNYGLVMDFEADNNYYLQVDVQDSLRVPMVVANMRLFGDSYVRVGRDDTRGAYITANFSGQITIADEYAPDLSSIPGMSMPYIGFQDFELDSDRGISCANWDFAGLTGSDGGPSGAGLAPPLFPPEGDDQGFAAGFPLSIDSMGLGGGLTSPKLYIKASLNFQQGENGISAGCALEFVGNFEDSGGGKKLRLDHVDLKGIFVDAEFSSITLKGSLEWNKNETIEEVKGSIEVGIPTGITVQIAAIFGTVKENEIAAHGSRQNHNYWMVDGAVSFGDSGIPICSGIAMYGLGGGVWHRMELIPERMNPARQNLTAGSSTAQFSAEAKGKYERNYDQILGLRFNVVLGIQNASSTVNLEVGFLAEFSESHGLTRLRIDGSVYVMQEMGTGQGEDEGGILYGQAALEYRYSPEDGKSFMGSVEVWLNVADIIKGAVDDNNKLAEVNFFADDAEWYFHMGSYDTSTGVINPGCAIKLTVGDTELLRASSYMMVGYRVPLELPLPPANVRDLLGMSSQSSGDNEVSVNDVVGPSTADYITGVRSEDGSFNTGEGFAFGTALTAHAGFEAFIYFALDITLGFDVNLTKQNYECIGFGAPGIDGWYAQGQAYAALEGELGLKFRFFGERRIQLLYLGVAMMLEAKLVRPNYFKGSAGVRFSVLGGVFEGRKTIKIEFGEKCEPLITDPLADIQFIEKIEPNQTSGDVSVFETPSVFFNFGMDNDLILPRSIHPDSGLPTSFYKFRPFVHDFFVKKHDTRAKIVGNDTYTPDRKILQFDKENAFAGNSRYDISCSVKVRDYTIDAPHPIYRKENGIEFLETKTEYFNTGDYPDVIPPINIKYTYPLQKQQYFLQNETSGRGAIALYDGMGASTAADQGLFYRTQDGVNFNYELRLTRANDFEDSRSIPVQYSSGKYIPLDIPNLENDEIYLAQIVRTVEQEQSASSSSPLNGFDAASHGINPQISNALERITIRTRLTNSGLGFSDLTVSRLTPESLIKLDETKLFEFYFKTSRHNTMRQKLAGAEVEAKTPSIGPHTNNTNIADVEIQLTEGFEKYDVDGFYSRGQRVVNPLIKYTDPMISDYWAKHGTSNIYYNMSRLNALREVDVVIDKEWDLPILGKYRIENWPNLSYSYPRVGTSGYAGSYYMESNRNIVKSPIAYSQLDYMINDHNELPASSTNNNALNIGLGGIANINNGALGNSIGGGFGGIFANLDHFFYGSSTKLLLHYDLSKQAYLKWRDTRSKINRFYYLKYNVPIGNNRYNLKKTIGEYIQTNPSPQRYNVSSVQNVHHQIFNYVTQPYIRYTEFGNQNVSNRYQVRFNYSLPILAAGIVPSSQVITKTFIMTADPTRTPSSQGPH